MQKGLPLISVIVPTFNYGSFIQEALASIFAQNYPADKIEVIVIDDGSTDNTREIIQNYTDRITYIYQDHSGVAVARNRGISLVKGEIVTFLDADDIWYADRIKKVVEQFRRHNEIGLVYHSIEVIDNEGKTVDNYIFHNFAHKKKPIKWLLSDIINGEVFCGGSSFSYTKSILEKTCPIPENIKIGVDFYLTAVASCYARALCIPEKLGKYRLHDKNITFTIKKDPIVYAIKHNNFSHTYNKLLSKISHIPSVSKNDLNLVRRRYFRSCMLSAVLSGHRFDGAKHLLALVKLIDSSQTFIRTFFSAFLLFVPKKFYIYAMNFHNFLKRIKTMKR